MSDTTHIEIESVVMPEKWERAFLDNDKLFIYLNGLWTGKKKPLVPAKVIRNTNFNNDGSIDYNDVAHLQVEDRHLREKELKCGDIIIERSGGGPSQPVGRVVYFDLTEKGYSFSNFTSTLRVVNPEKVHSKFLLYYLHMFYLDGNTLTLQQKTTGIRNLNFADYKKSPVPLPPLDEQTKIAAILSKIQQAIEVQERIIERVKELKRALMAKLFTEGLHGEEQKQTEIGLIPESWEVIRLGSLFKLSSGTSRPKNTSGKSSAENPYPVFGGNGVLGYSKEYFMSTPTLVLGRVGVYCGNAFVAEGKYWVSDNALYAKELQRDCDLHYVCEFLRYYDLNRFRHMGGQPLITQGIVNERVVPFPPLAEQKGIAEVFHSLDGKLLAAVDKKSTLRELFKSMLHQLITGQIRVRKYEIPLDA